MSKTVTEVRNELRSKGVSVSKWAREHGFPVSSVSAILRGQHQGYYGQARRIRIALGLEEAEK